MANNNSLLSFWARQPADQLTPKASAQSGTSKEFDPFDAQLRLHSHPISISNNPPLSLSDSNSNSHPSIPAPLNLISSINSRMPLSPNSASHNDLQNPPLTPKPAHSQLSMAANALKAIAPSPVHTPPSIVPLPPRPPVRHQNSIALPPKGRLSVKIISARALKCTAAARPYVVAQFDHNEFVSREPIAEDASEARGVVSGVSGGGRREGSSGSADIGKDGSLNGSGLLCLSGQNPCWKQTVDFDVAQHDPTPVRPTLHVSVYDRSVGDHPSGSLPGPGSGQSSSSSAISGIEGVEMFLGETEIELDFERLVGRAGWVEEWYELTMKTPESTGPAGPPSPSTLASAGAIKVSLQYREQKSRKSLSVSDFEFLRMIGKGTFGRVFQVRKKDTRRIYAMKVLSKREVIDKKEVAHTIGERDILKQSNLCPFLLGLKFSFQSPGELFLVMDYKSGGELFHHLQKEGRFTEERARFYTAEIVLALEHLHKYNIVYRDLKPENILLDATGHIVLCDFGLSKPNLRPDELTTTFCGTTEYLAPEVLLDDHGYSKLVDFWSLGVLLFEMCCGWSPFYAEDNQEMYKNICFGKIKFPRGVIGDDGKQFVKALLNRNPKHRLGANLDAIELKEHAFFKSLDWQLVSNRQIVPPFKPHIESDDCVANFDVEFTGLNVQEQLPMTVLLGDGNGNGSGKGGGGGKGWFDEEDKSADWVTKASSYGIQQHGPYSIGGGGSSKWTTTTATTTTTNSTSRKSEKNPSEGQHQLDEERRKERVDEEEIDGIGFGVDGKEEKNGVCCLNGKNIQGAGGGGASAIGGGGGKHEEQDEFLGFSYHGESEYMLMHNNQHINSSSSSIHSGGGERQGVGGGPSSSSVLGMSRVE